jgi:hypothetical protein
LTWAANSGHMEIMDALLKHPGFMWIITTTMVTRLFCARRQRTISTLLANY